jgi:hypothetical protein
VSAEPDYTRLLRMHMFRMSGVFGVLALAWIITVIGGNLWPVLTVTALAVAAVSVSRIRVRQLAAARDDEKLIRALRESLEGL